MKHTRIITHLLLGSILFLSSCSSDDDIKLEETFDHEKMDLLFTTIEEKNLGMGSISIYEGGDEVYQMSFGEADISNAMSTTGQTKFRIGSISKTYTAAMVMQLIDEGKLTLATTLSEYFPEIPNATTIAIEHLLRHRSGLYNFTNSEDYLVWMTETKNQTELIEIFVENGTVFEPNERAEYSNTNYVLLSFIIEIIDAKDFSEAVKDRIASPLGLSNTYYGGSINTANNEAFSYYFQNNNWILASEVDMSIPQGAGAIVSTPTDINTFYHALFAGQVVTASSLEKMQTIEDNFGIGLLQIPFHTRSGFGHTGGIDGFQSMAIYFPVDGVAIAYTSNGVSMSMNDVLIGALSIYFGLEYTLL